MRMHLAAAGSALLMLAGACTDSTDDASTSSSVPVSASAPVPSSTEAPTSTTAPVPLTASFRGVSAEAISVGVAIVDLDELNQLGFVDFTHGNKEAIYQALFDELNEQGGILGRRLDPVYETILPIANTAGEEACLRLTEDHEVFVVLGIWIGESVLCVTDDHETNYIGHQTSQSMMDRSVAVLASPDINPERRLEALLSVLGQTGRLDDETVGILTQTTMEDSVRSEAVPRLEGLGASVGTVGVITSADDAVAAGAELATFVERWQSEGVTTVLFLGATAQDQVPETVDAMGDITKISDDPEVARQLAASSGRADAYAGMITMNGLNSTTREQFDEPLLQECFDIVVDQLPELDEVVPPSEVVDGDPDWYTGIRDACTNLAVLVAGATAAGPELTNDTFRTGIESVGSVAIPGKVFSSLGPGKYDAEDGFRLYEFDPSVGEDGAFVPQSDIVDVTQG
ncbi:MAG: hypothetical protein OEW42_16135 [Acidimicrobiia bacterium]|nr:hypothetical protein [Acidimicrobiia bacterium]